jgi:molecular chaperone DnaK
LKLVRELKAREMASHKINYGIDLGTTNSTIARIENGKPIIKKTDTLKDTMPSCIGYNRNKALKYGDDAYNTLDSDRKRAMKNWDKSDTNIFIEFKRTMGTDKKYPCSNIGKDLTSEELSSEVLKTLKSFVTDDTIQSVVITVPAKFTINQKDATVRAAKLAGFRQMELLQEPIAASMAYGLDSKLKNGYWVVFDFGGGTFDAALIKLDEGIMQVIDTEGDNHLGGKNLDYSVVDEIIIPAIKNRFSINSILKDNYKKGILQDAMKTYAERAKIHLSFNESYNILSDLGDIPGKDDNGYELELDINVSQDDIKKAVSPFFQKAIDITKDLLKRNNFPGSKLDALILVGGPTFSPILRKMLEEQICKPDVKCNPMTVVAEGAALYAATINVSEDIKEESRDKSKIQLSLGYEASTVEEEELITLKILEDKTISPIPEIVFAEITRGDKAWSSGRNQINSIGEVIEVKLNKGRPNSFIINLFNQEGNFLECEPNEFTIIQGTKMGSATLPYNIGIEIKSSSLNRIIVTSIKGLEKNNSYPATGVRNGLKTQKEVRPGVKNDFIRIAIFEMDYGAEGSRPIYNEHVFDAVINGEDLPTFLPEGSEVDVTVKCLGDGKIKLAAYFPSLDHTQEIEYDSEAGIQKEIDDKWLEVELKKAKHALTMIDQDGVYPDKAELKKIQDELDELNHRFEQGRSDDDRKKDVLDNLKRKFRRIDEIQDASEWPKTESELKNVFYNLEETNKQFGNEKTTGLVTQFKTQVGEAIKEKNVKIANQLIDDMRALGFALVDQGLGAKLEIMLIQEFNEDFDTHAWSDKNKARTLINQGLEIAASNPSKQKLRPIVIGLYALLPNIKKPIFEDDTTVLRD